MEASDLLLDVTFYVHGRNLPSIDDIKSLSLEDKEKLMVEQNQIIDIFRDQALLDIKLMRDKLNKIKKKISELQKEIIPKEKFGTTFQPSYKPSRTMPPNKTEIDDNIFKKFKQTTDLKSPSKFANRRKKH